MGPAPTAGAHQAFNAALSRWEVAKMSSPARSLVMKTPLALVAAGRATADANGTGVDVSAFEGFGTVDVWVHNVSGTTPTYDGFLEESDTVGGTYTAVPGAAITQVTTTDSMQQLSIDWSARKAFVRWVDDVAASGTPVYDRVVIAQGQKKQAP